MLGRARANSELADSGGKGSDVSVIRDLAQEQGPQRNQPVSRLAITKRVGEPNRSVHLLCGVRIWG